MKDYSSILGVSPSSPSAEIRRVYRRLALQYHPDKNPSPEAGQIFQEINEAYEILSDQESRRWYDYKRQTGNIPNLSPDDIYANVRTTHRDPAYRKRKPQTSSQRVNEKVEMMKAYLPYVSWLTWAGLATLIIFILDYSLPLVHATEKVVATKYSTIRGNSSYIVKTTNHYVRLYEGPPFENGIQVDLQSTPFLRVVFKITDHDHVERSATSRGVYGPVIFIPLLLFGLSIAGYFLRKNLEYSFNINVTIGLIYLPVLYFILYG